jgi:rfaE bifunctional protein kinase chain/domain
MDKTSSAQAPAHGASSPPGGATPASFDLAQLRNLVDGFRGRRLLVLGDLMLDRYLWGRVDRISPEAPVPVVDVERESFSLGGAGNVAANLCALGAQALLAGLAGDDAAGDALLRAIGERGVDTRLVVREPGRPTTVKTRVIAHSQQVVRVDHEVRGDVDGESRRQLLAGIVREIGACAGLIVSDYGKGVITPETLGPTLAAARDRGVHVSVDPKESHIDAYRGVGILTPNQHEAGGVMGVRIRDEASLMDVGRRLRDRLDAAALLVTRGPQGMSLFERDGRYTYLPTVAREVYDVTGAGDTVVSVVALALAAGADYPTACHLANHAAGVVIREVGTATCPPGALLASLAGVVA